jgi:hypothetical protein
VFVGFSRSVSFASGNIPEWTSVAQSFANRRAIKLQMIDGQLALPGETPSKDWKELRVGFSEGSVTIRRVDNNLTFTIWSNSHADLVHAMEDCVEAYRRIGNGVVETIP